MGSDPPQNNRGPTIAIVAIVLAALIVGASVYASSFLVTRTTLTAAGTMTSTETITMPTTATFPVTTTATVTAPANVTVTTTTPTVCYSYVVLLPVNVSATSTDSSGTVKELGSFDYGGNPCVTPGLDVPSNTTIQITITTSLYFEQQQSIVSAWITCLAANCPPFTIGHAANISSTHTYSVTSSSTVTSTFIGTEWQVQMTFTTAGSYPFTVSWQYRGRNRGGPTIHDEREPMTDPPRRRCVNPTRIQPGSTEISPRLPRPDSSPLPSPSL